MNLKNYSQGSYNKLYIYKIYSQGSFKCGECLEGYMGDPQFGCEPIPECGSELPGAVNPCDSNAGCVVARGKAFCQVCAVARHCFTTGIKILNVLRVCYSVLKLTHFCQTFIHFYYLVSEKVKGTKIVFVIILNLFLIV